MGEAFQIGDIIQHHKGKDNALILDIYPVGHEKNPYALRSAYVLLFIAADRMPVEPTIWSTKPIDKYYTKVA